jgi:hypothetical protein
VKRVSEDANTLLIFNPIDVKKTELKTHNFGPTKIPLDVLKTNMEKVLAEIGSIFKDAQNKLGNCRVDSADVTLGITVDGKIGLFGTQIGAEANGGITIHLIFTNQDAIHQNDV